MPERLIPILDSILMTFVSIGLFVMSAGLLTIIPTILATLFWCGKIKKEVDTKHDGSFIKYLKAIVKKNSK